MGRLRIEAATDRDVPVLLGLIKELAEYERLAHLVVATEDDLRASLFGPAPNTEAVIASLDGKPVGYALWFYTYSTFLGKRGIYLEDLFVVPDARRNGVGRALMRHLARVAVARDCIRIEWAVLNWNDPAIRFYKGMGAKPNDEWMIYNLSGDALRRVAAQARIFL